MSTKSASPAPSSVNLLEDDNASGGSSTVKVKKKNKFLKALTVFLIMALIGGITVIAVLDLWGMRTNVLSALGLLDSEAQDTATVSPQESMLEDERRRVEALKFELSIQKDTLTELDAALALREQAVAEKEAELALATQEVELLRSSLQQSYNDMSEYIKMFRNMPAKNAAAVLEAINNDAVVARILRNMKSQDAANIMAKMSPEFAARVSVLLMP